MHFRQIWLSTLLFGVLSACNGDDPPRDTRDAGHEGDAHVSDSAPVMGIVPDAAVPFDATVRVDATVDATVVVDASACVPLGCEELGYECGETVNNCGGPLNCNLAGNASPCAAPQRCAGDPARGANKCGCAPRANVCALQGAQCGTIDECGTPVDCGTCAAGSVCLGHTCTCTPNSNPCGDRVCGMAPNGCGSMVACGANGGNCAAGTCSAAGQCDCRPRAEACAGKTGAITENGCTYNCDTACVPDNATACAGAECGTATNNCGDVINCGTAAGACSDGNSCVSGQFITDSTLPARTASYQGGYCVPTNVSKLIGKYAARAHGFRQAGNTTTSFINRAEAVSLITNRYTRATQKTQMVDVGCVATTINSPNFLLGTRSIVPNYRKLDPITVDITVTGSTWARGDVPHPQLGAGVPNGYTIGMPAFCAGKAGMEVDLPAADPRRGTFWADNKCVCPAEDKVNAVPANVYTVAGSRDCRLIDSDGDGKPGFTALARLPLQRPNDPLPAIYNANVSHGVWSGVIRDDRYHVGTIGEAVQPMQRAVLGCSVSSFACAEPSLDCGCPERLQPIQFVPLPDADPMSCDVYYQTNNDPLMTVKQAVVDAQFGAAYGSCSAAGQCPAGAICRLNKCVAMTSNGACGTASRNPCTGMAGTYCEPCPAGTECLSDEACWPTTAICPARGPIGGLCAAPAP